MAHKATSISLYQEISWKKQNKFLQQDAQDNIQLKKQINKQTDADNLIQTNINDKIYELKVQATDLAKKLENQKYKNRQLQSIVKAMKIRMESQRREECSISNDVTNNENNQMLDRKSKKLEYDLSQINGRNNKISSIVSQGKHQISLLRTQRCIDSTIFRNIEKELINQEMSFKKLLIDKIQHQKIYQETLNEYSSLKNRANHYFANQQTSRKSISLHEGIDLQKIQEQRNTQMTQQLSRLNFNNKFKHTSRHSQMHSNHKFKQLHCRVSQFHRQLNHTFQESRHDKNQQANYEFVIKKLLVNLNINNVKEFEYLWNNIEQINSEYFQELNKTSDQITKLQEELNRIQLAIQEGSIKFYKAMPDLTRSQKVTLNCKRIKDSITNLKTESDEQMKSFYKFTKSQFFNGFLKCLSLSEQRGQNQLDLEEFSQLFQQIEENMNKYKFYSVLGSSNNEQNILQTGRSEREKEKKQQKLQDIINRVKIQEQSDKIMKRQDFREQYRKIFESGTGQNSRQNFIKKKSRKALF